MAEESGKKSFLDRFAEVSAKIGNEVHLRSLRDAFATVCPLYILAGVAVLINNVVFPLFLSGRALADAKVWGSSLTNGTLNVAGLMIAFVIGYCLSKNKRFGNPIAAGVMSVAALVTMMPATVTATVAATADGLTGDALAAAQSAVSASGLPSTALAATASGVTAGVSGVLSFTNLGTSGMFSGIIIGLVATELFIRVSAVDKLRIDLGENVPQAVNDSFNVMLPMLIVLAGFGVAAAVFAAYGADLITSIKWLVQEPLRAVNTSLPGTILIYTCANLLFTLGIHQSVISGVLAEPLLTINITDNMAAFAAGTPLTDLSTYHVMNMDIVNQFALFGGSGCTLCLIIAVLVFSRDKTSRDIIKMAAVPGIFNINEPIIFGFPIVFNIPLMIPFIIVPTIGMLISYGATVAGLMNPCVVMVPWTTPAFLSGFLATGGDWRAIIVQGVIIAIGVAVYLPFLKVSERVTQRQLEMEREAQAGGDPDAAGEPQVA